MRGIRLTEPGQLDLIELPHPGPPGPGEVLARVLRVGICGTDLHAFEGRQTYFTYPRVLGHELAVQVESVGEDAGPLSPGDRCCVEPFLNCGACGPCRRGRTNCCESLRTLGVHVDGGMCEWIRLPASKLHPASRLSWEQMATVEPLCIGAHAVARAAIERGDAVLVIGAGPIGLAVLESAKASEAAGIEVAEISPRRIEFVRRHMPSVRIADSQASQAGTPQPRYHVVFDCTGSARSMQDAFERVAHGGKLVFVGHQPGDIRFANPLFHGREMTLFASRNATAADFRRVIAKLETGEIDTRGWLDALTPPDQFARLFPRWLDPASGVIKPMLSWG